MPLKSSRVNQFHEFLLSWGWRLSCAEMEVVYPNQHRKAFGSHRNKTHRGYDEPRSFFGKIKWLFLNFQRDVRYAGVKGA